MQTDYCLTLWHTRRVSKESYFLTQLINHMWNLQNIQNFGKIEVDTEQILEVAFLAKRTYPEPYCTVTPTRNKYKCVGKKIDQSALELLVLQFILHTTMWKTLCRVCNLIFVFSLTLHKKHDSKLMMARSVKLIKFNLNSQS